MLENYSRILHECLNKSNSQKKKQLRNLCMFKPEFRIAPVNENKYCESLRKICTKYIPLECC